MRYFNFKSDVIKKTIILNNYLKNMIQELEANIPAVKIVIQKEKEEFFGNEKEKWTCPHCKYTNKNPRRKICMGCGKDKRANLRGLY